MKKIPLQPRQRKSEIEEDGEFVNDLSGRLDCCGQL